MSKGLYLGVNDTSKAIGRVMIGIDGKAKEVKEAYVGVNGVAKCIGKARSVSGGTEVVKKSNAPNASVSVAYKAATTFKDYFIFAGGSKSTDFSNASGITSAVDIYKNLIKSSVSLTDTRYDASGISNDQYAFVIGGRYGYLAARSNANVFDDNLTRTSIELTYAGSGIACTSIDNTVIAAGGSKSCNSKTSTNYGYVQTIDENLVVSKASSNLSKSRGWASAECVNKKIIIAGGSNAYATALNTVDAYDENLVKTNITSLSSARSCMGSVSFNDYAIFAGGGVCCPSRLSDAKKAVVDCYDSNLTRTSLSNLSIARKNMGSATMQNYCLFAGGNTGQSYTSITTNVDIYNKELVKTIDKLNTASSTLCATSTNTQTLVSAGRTSSSWSSIVEVFEEKDLTKYYFD